MNHKRANGTNAEKELYKKDDEDPGFSQDDSAIEALGLAIQDNLKTINAPDWASYEQAHAQSRNEGAQDVFLQWRVVRAVARASIAVVEAPTHRFASFVYAQAHTREPNAIFNNVAIPVGEYGEEFARDLLKSTVYTIQKLDEVVDAEAAAATVAHTDVLRNYTARAPKEGDDEPTATSTKATLQEGALSSRKQLHCLRPSVWRDMTTLAN